MSEFVSVCKVSEVPDPGKRICEVADSLVVLFHVDQQFYCLDDVCTHDGGPLSDGVLTGCEIACPRHGAKFDVRNGKALTMPATEDTLAHEVRVDGDEVQIRLRED